MCAFLPGVQRHIILTIKRVINGRSREIKFNHRKFLIVRITPWVIQSNNLLRCQARTSFFKRLKLTWVLRDQYNSRCCGLPWVFVSELKDTCRLEANAVNILCLSMLFVVRRCMPRTHWQYLSVVLSITERGQNEYKEYRTAYQAKNEQSNFCQIYWFTMRMGQSCPVETFENFLK